MRGPAHRQWNSVGAAAVMVAALLLGACASSQPSSSSAPPTRIDDSELLTPGDIGPGWTSAATDTSAVEACSSPPSITSIAGPNGVGVRLVGPGGSPELVEFAAATTSVENAYIAAIRRLENQSPCSQTTDRNTTSGKFEEVLPLPTYGDHSVAMLVSNDADGALSQAGYVVVRRGTDLVVVGYVDPGPVDTAALQEYTTAALANIHG